MTHSNDATSGDYLAEARTSLKATEPTKNPFKAGWQRGKANWDDAQASTAPARKRGKLKFMLLGFGLFAILAVSSGRDPDGNSGRPESAATTQTTTALDAMTKLFKGGYSRNQIELETTTVLRLFDIPVTEASLDRLGGQMLALQKNVNPRTEMDLLRCIRDTRRDGYGSNVRLEETAAVCATSFQMGF